MDERAIGYQHGLVSALASMKLARGVTLLKLNEIPQHHTRRSASVMLQVAALDRAYESVERELRRLQSNEGQSDG